MRGEGHAPRLICAGSVVIDVVMRVPTLPEAGGDVAAQASRIAVGGAFNVMSAARRQGLAVTYASGHGSGPFGDMVRSQLAAMGIEMSSAPTAEMDTGFSVTFVTPDGERTFATATGAEGTATDASLAAAPISPQDIVYVSGYGLAHPECGPALARWMSQLDPRITVVLDPGPLVATIPAAIFRAVATRCDWWTCNEREARLITGLVSPDEAARRLLEMTGRAGVLVRLGGKGCLLLVRGGEVRSVPARSVVAVDTTGAGDAHTGTFISMLARHGDPFEAARIANVAASITISRAGSPIAPTADELRDALVNRA